MLVRYILALNLMKNVIEKLKVLMLSSWNIGSDETSTILLIESKQGKTLELIHAKNAGCVVGIHCPTLGDGIILTKIEDVLGDWVVLKLFDLTGTTIDVVEISIDEI